MIAVLFMRFGVLAVMVCLAIDMVLTFQPLSSDLTNWFAHATIVSLLVVGAFTLFGVWASTTSTDVREFPA